LLEINKEVKLLLHVIYIPVQVKALGTAESNINRLAENSLKKCNDYLCCVIEIFPNTKANRRAKHFLKELIIYVIPTLVNRFHT